MRECDGFKNVIQTNDSNKSLSEVTSAADLRRSRQERKSRIRKGEEVVKETLNIFGYHRRSRWRLKIQPTKMAWESYRYPRRESGEFQGPAFPQVEF